MTQILQHVWLHTCANTATQTKQTKHGAITGNRLARTESRSEQREIINNVAIRWE